VNAEERLKAAGWTRLHQPCDLTMYRWTQDGIDWFTEDEALVVVLTAERDAAIAALSEKKLELGRERDRHDECGRAFMRTHKERDAAIARAEAAEALAASRLDVSPELACGWLSERLGGPATSAVFAALRAHAAKVSR